MSDPTTSPIIDDWMKVMIIVFIIVAIFEGALLAVAYFNADEVECNWLWCSFKTTRGSTVITEDCFQNGIRINCTGMHEIQSMINDTWRLKSYMIRWRNWENLRHQT